MRINKRAWKKNCWRLYGWDGHPPSKRRSREAKKILRRLGNHIRANYNPDLLKNVAKKYVVDKPYTPEELNAFPVHEYSWRKLNGQ